MYIYIYILESSGRASHGLDSSWPQPSAAYLLDQLNVPYTPILSVCEPSDKYSRHMWETLFATLWFADYFFTIFPQPGIQLACSGALKTSF